MGPNIEYARHPAVESQESILRHDRVAGVITDYLQSLSNNSKVVANLSKHAIRLIEEDKPPERG